MPRAVPPAEPARRGFRSLVAGAAPMFAYAACALHLAVLTCFTGRWDATAAITIIPIWAWSCFGLTLAVPAWLAARGPLATLAVALWGLTLILLPDEWHGVRRAAFSTLAAPTPDRPAGQNPAFLRVVTHNCRSRNILSARQAAAWNPDVLLLQEMRGSPLGPLGDLARELWGNEGSLVIGYDTVILARGRLTPTTRTPPGQPQQFTQATLTLPDGRQLEIASVHLQGHVTDLDLWNPRTWRAHAQNQRRHRLYISDIIMNSLAAASSRPCLVGGDFNSPAGDRAFFALRSRFDDAFTEAGLGWGNTFRNDWPVLRIDQIWATRELRPRAARTIASRHSDHRLVVVDFEWP